MSKLYVMFGKSATGKDTLYAEIMKNNKKIKHIVPYTTRPMREAETEGKEYHFVSDEEFFSLKESGKIVEYRQYDTVHGVWYYFTPDDGQLSSGEDEIFLAISTLEGYVKLKEYYGNMVKPIYLYVDDITRIERAIGREKEQKEPCVAEVCRRFLADEEDFSEEKLKEAGIDETNTVCCLHRKEAVRTIERQLYGYKD